MPKKASFKIIFFSDIHLDFTTAGVRRYDDVCRAMDEVAAKAVEVEADAVFCLGDVANPERVQSHRAVAKCIEFSVGLKNHGIDSHWLTGNHDVIEDGSGGHVLEAVAAAGFAVWDRPTYHPLGHPLSPLRLMALPYVARVANYDPAAFVRECTEQDARRLMDGVYGERWASSPLLVIGHLNAEGIGPGSETKDLPRGRDVFWPIDTLENLYPQAHCFGGHYHMRQQFNQLQIVGSLQRLTFAEELHKPQFLVWEVAI